MDASLLDPDHRPFQRGMREYAKRVDQPVVIEPAIGDAGMVRIAKQVVDPVDAEGIAGHDLGHEQIPLFEICRVAEPFAPLLRTDGDPGPRGQDQVKASCLSGRRASPPTAAPPR